MFVHGVLDELATKGESILDLAAMIDANPPGQAPRPETHAQTANGPLGQLRVTDKACSKTRDIRDNHFARGRVIIIPQKHPAVRPRRQALPSTTVFHHGLLFFHVDCYR